MNERVLGTGFYEISSALDLMDPDGGDHAVLLLERKGTSTAVPLDTEGIDTRSRGELVARVVDTSTVPGLAWRRQHPHFVDEGEETVIAAGYPRPGRRPFRRNAEGTALADSLHVHGGTENDDLSGILHSRIQLIWRTA